MVSPLFLTDLLSLLGWPLGSSSIINSLRIVSLPSFEIISSSSWMVSICALLIVFLRWMGHCVLSTDVAVVSFDVVGVPTIATGALATLRSGLFAMMAVSFCKCHAYCSFLSAVGGTNPPNSLTKSVAAIIVSSSWRRLGILQWVGKAWWSWPL